VRSADHQADVTYGEVDNCFAARYFSADDVLPASGCRQTPKDLGYRVGRAGDRADAIAVPLKAAAPSRAEDTIRPSVKPIYQTRTSELSLKNHKAP